MTDRITYVRGYTEHTGTALQYSKMQIQVQPDDEEDAIWIPYSAVVNTWECADVVSPTYGAIDPGPPHDDETMTTVLELSKQDDRDIPVDQDYCITSSSYDSMNEGDCDSMKDTVILKARIQLWHDVCIELTKLNNGYTLPEVEKILRTIDDAFVRTFIKNDDDTGT